MRKMCKVLSDASFDLGMKRKIIMIVLKYIIAIVIGAGLGYLYYSKIGCSSGSCPIASNPYVSTIYGGVLGLLLAGII